MMAPVIDELAKKLQHLHFYKVDIDKDDVAHSVANANVTAVVLP